MPHTDPLQNSMYNSEYIEHLRDQIEEKDEQIRELHTDLEEKDNQTSTLRGELGV